MRDTNRAFIARFARHRTAANLLMLLLLLVGFVGLMKLNRQIFPDFEVPVISVSVAWPGASAEDVNKAILDVLEPQLRSIDGAEKTRATAKEGVATIFLEFAPTADMQKAQADVEQAISTITNLPESADPPELVRAAVFEPVARIAVSSSASEEVLKRHAQTLKDGLLAAGIEHVDLRGDRNTEIWVQIREPELRRLALSVEEVSQKIKDNTQDLPVGTLAGSSERQITIQSDRKTPEEIGAIEIKALTTGEKIYLHDIAKIETRYDRDGQVGLSRGRRAIELLVRRSPSSDTIRTMRITEAYVERARHQLPETVELQIYDVTGKFVDQRLGILFWNGLQGLGLVLIALFVFLNLRVAFWTAAGIPIAIIATLAVMWISGQSINMISMFGLIMMVGIIVDDAIVVGEHTAALEQAGVPRLAAAEQGAMHMLAPVTAAILTTAVSFLPIFFISDRIGDIMRAIPLVVLAALIASMIECFLILPAHLSHKRDRARRPSTVRRAIDGGFAWFRDRMFRPTVLVLFRWRYSCVATMVAGLIISFGAVKTDHVRFVFFPKVEAETISASIYFLPGVPKSRQKDIVASVEAALYKAETQLLAQSSFKPLHSDRNRDGHLVEASFGIVGQAVRQSGPNVAEVNAQLTANEVRPIRTQAIIDAWRAAIPDLIGIERLAVYGRRSGPPGRDVDVRLQNAPLEVLKRAAEELKAALTGIRGVSAIEDDLPYGKEELVLELTPRGTALGFTATGVGQQVRNVFEGAIATRFARGRDEITVRVLHQQEAQGVAALHRIYLRAPNGGRVALTDVVRVRERLTFSRIQRRQGLATVAVQADIDDTITTTTKIVERLERDVMPELSRKYGLTYTYGGRAEEIAGAFEDLTTGVVLSISLIYMILALVFGSYSRPFAIMAIIPFGFVGAVWGHYVMDFDMTMPSLIGLLGLSGILVNDSIVLVVRLIEREQAGETAESAAVGAACDRLRAVLLTSLTTIGGLTPLLFETNLQAQFLIPLAITIVFGLITATAVVLVLVPCLVGIVADIIRIAQSVFALDARRSTSDSQSMGPA
jgi:multidrug efflux pump subunit AcrB